MPVVTGVAEYATGGACRFAAEAGKIGADGLTVLPGMVYKARPHENIHHFRAVARASGLPIMVYNNPVSYGVDLKPEHIAQLADEPTIVAVKESSDDPRRITDLFNLCGDRFLLLGGVDDLAIESMLLGAVGWVSGLVNAFPEENRLHAADARAVHQTRSSRGWDRQRNGACAAEDSPGHGRGLC